MAIVDDDVIIQNKLKQYIKEYEKEKKEKFYISIYSDAFDIVEQYNGLYDIIFMDIQMEKMDGLTAAERIRAVDKNVIIIFVTNMSGYAIQGYKVDALSYVVKPIVYVDFVQQLDKAVNRIALSKSAFLLVTVNSEIIRLDITKICYMESIEHKVYIHLEDETISIYNSLSNLEQLVKNFHFARCNSCFLVSLKHVESIEKDCVVVGGAELVISRSKKKNFMNALAEYIGGEYI
ncbi:LytTR family DNA-binding domain-containing protein [Fusibacter bizertensis]|uniref:Stage 0 sporulation protein A homolog n=1 Tax=Fusibacter bizertensis TaxID=1488331 RepID=A0ABT6N9F2_9FIRM|nr:LytTR family DNA-binding domain-containing protein [Fusibacter bizertensis]MDH8677019.1 LytTR family DNA-binding domain-containing protein [Fusibacter bizertensis]